jgi:hypothetical protein
MSPVMEITAALMALSSPRSSLHAVSLRAGRITSWRRYVRGSDAQSIGAREGRAEMGYARRESIPQRVKVAIAFLLEQKNDLAAAALHAGMDLRELKRAMGLPQVRRYSLEQRQIALEAFCLGSPAALTKVRDESENGMAVVASIKAGEQLRIGAIEAEAAAKQRMPGLQIVLIQKDGSREQVPMTPSVPMLDVTAAEPVPAIPSDADEHP